MRQLLALLPLLTFMFTAAWFLAGRDTATKTESAIHAWLCLFLAILVSTELLSALNAFNTRNVILVWSVLLLVSVSGWRVYRHKRLPDTKQAGLRPRHLMSILAMTLLMALIAACWWLYPPNTWDSMTYHLARAAQWISQSSVDFYPTAIARQNYQPPLAEYALAHLILLTGGDRFSGLVQYTAFAICIVTVGQLSRTLGSAPHQRRFAMLLMATLPMGILQASSTQNDLLVASFLLVFAWSMSRLSNSNDQWLPWLAGISLGLALLTKGTALIIGAAIFTVSAVCQLVRTKGMWRNVSQRIKVLILIVVMALLVNLPHWSRNQEHYGHPLSPESSRYTNQVLGFQTLLANATRNTALHMVTPLAPLNDLQYHLLRDILAESLDNPATTWQGRYPYPMFRINEDYSGNAIHALLFAWFLIWLVRSGWRKEGLLSYFGGLLLAFTLFCWLLKWQEWGSRLHTPLWALATPLIAASLGRNSINRWIRWSVALALVAYAAPFVLFHETRPLIPAIWKAQDREKLYFMLRPELHDPYLEMAQRIRQSGVKEVGLFLQENDWEYPLWVFIGDSHFKFTHIRSAFSTEFLETPRGKPKLIIATRPITDWDGHRCYTQQWKVSGMELLENVQSDELLNTECVNRMQIGEK